MIRKKKEIFSRGHQNKSSDIDYKKNPNLLDQSNRVFNRDSAFQKRTNRMFPKIFLAFFPVLARAFGVPVEMERSPARKPDNLIFEQEIIKLFQNIRKLMKEGDLELGIKPMEPLRHEAFHFDFFMEETELKGSLSKTVIERLSDFEIRNLTVEAGKRIEANGTIAFDKIEMYGLYDLSGILFGDLPVSGLGSYRVVTDGLTFYFRSKIRSKACVPNFEVFDVTFQLGGISVVYNDTRNGETDSGFDEEFLFEIIDRFRTLYLPSLLNTLKILINDFIDRMYDTWDSFPVHFCNRTN